jgi:hypothetical protein
MRDLVDGDYPDADRVRVVMDNLSTHTASAIYQTFPAAEHVGFCDVWNSTTRPATRVGSIWPRSRSASCTDSALTVASTTATCSKARFRDGSVVEPIAVLKSDGCSQSIKRAKRWLSLIQHQCSMSQDLGDGTLGLRRGPRATRIRAPSGAAIFGLSASGAEPAIWAAFRHECSRSTGFPRGAVFLHHMRI